MTKFISASEAVKYIENYHTVGISGSGGCGSPEALLTALKMRYKKEQQPYNLTITTGISAGNGTYDEVGLNHLLEKGLIKRAICAHYGKPKGFGDAAANNEFAAYALPLGVYGHLLRAIASNKPGVITKVGIGTFMDPCLEGGKLNKKAQKEKYDFINFYNLNFEDYIFYKSFPINIALIKASYADECGNVSLMNEAVIGEQKELAAAVHNSGGIVICEVEEKVSEIKAQDIVIHNTLIDYIVINKPAKELGEFNTPCPHPELLGQIKQKDSDIKELPFSERKICGRRAFQELHEGNIVNLGVGIPETVALIAKEENYIDKITLSVEMGPLGGIPISGICFGAAINPECINSTPETFDLYDGGYLDVAILGMGEVDRYGNVNVSKFGKIVTGPGGFINITQNTKKILFLGTLCAKDGTKKFVKNVSQITFSGKIANKNKQEILYITEKAVFRLVPKGIELIEIAPDTDLEKDILNIMEFKPMISKKIKIMDKRLFKA